MAITKRTKNRKTQYRFEIRYKDAMGATKRKCSKWFNTKAKAVKAEHDFRAQPAASCKATFKTVYTDWLEHQDKTAALSYLTVDQRRRVIAHRFTDWDDVPVSKLTPVVLRKRFEQDDILNLSASYQIKLRSILKMIFDFAVKYYELDKNPMKYLDPVRKKKVVSLDDEQTVWSPEQFQQFVMALDPEDDYTALLQFIYWMGFRKGEAMSLTFDCLTDDILHLYRQWDFKRDEWTTLKTKGSERYIRIPEAMMDIYNQQLEKYKDQPGFGMDWFVFGGARPLARTTLDRRKNDAIKKTGLPYIKIHGLRHSYVSNMLQQEDNIYLVSRSVGHTNTGMTTGTYGHVHVSDFASKIDSLYSKSMPKIPKA